METKLILYPLLPSKLRSAMAKSCQRSKSSPSPSTASLRQFSALRATASPDSNPEASGEGKESDGDRSDATTERRGSPTTLNIRYRARSRNQAKQEQQKLQQQGLQKPPPPRKNWEDMTLSEKGLELYLGEKGILFWLNKFAYASIFAVIGGWILFRFVGPSLGLYQLDSAPLSPTSILKGGSS